MRKSPLFMAIALALVCSQTNAQNAEVTNGPAYNPSEVSSADRSATAAKRSALTGYLHEEDSLRELRDLLRENEVAKEKRDSLAVDLTPEEVIAYRKRMAALDRAENQPIFGDAEFRIRNLTYDPDSNRPLIISVSPGWSSQIEFYDSSGKPWPIRDEGIIGDGESFEKYIMGEDKHIASFVLTRNYRKSNAAIILDGLSASIPLLLSSDEKNVDGKVTVTLPRLGPNAMIMPVFEHEIENISPELVGLQGGTAPAGSRALSVPGIRGAEAWYDGEFLYMALPGRLLLPPPINSSMSPTGRYLYKMSPTPYVTASINGERKGSTIEGMYRTDIRRAKTVFEEDR